MAAAWNDLPATGGLDECGALVRSAEALDVSAPELAVQLARRALLVGAIDGSASTAGQARSLSLRAQAVLTSGLVRISQHAGAVEPGFAALALAESGGAPEVAAHVRLDLAACAHEVGEPLLGGALLRPVLEAQNVRPSVRAAALGRLIGCIAHVARRDDVEDALAEADRLLAADDGLSPDARRMERARLSVRSAAYHRWYGDNEDAVTAARDGLGLLDRLRRELRSESDRLRARLVLELVCALLDEGELRDAEAAASPTVDEPVRATSAASVGQLMLAMATRVHLPAGQVDRARSLLDQAAWVAERHGLDSVLADALTEVSRLDEQAGRTADALQALRAARAAEQRRLRSVARAVRLVLTEVGAGQGVKDVSQQSVTALLRQLAHPAGVPVAMAPPHVPSPLPPPRVSPEPRAPAPDSGELTGSVEPPSADEVPVDEVSVGKRSVDAVPLGAASSDAGRSAGLLDREGLLRRLRSVRKGERPVALTLLRFEPNGDPTDAGGAAERGPDTGIMAGLADKVRGMAPDHAELARSDGGELAVLLPHTTRDEAEEFAATVRETAIESDWLADATGKDMSISTGVVQSGPPATDDDTQVDGAGMLTAARDALTPAGATDGATAGTTTGTTTEAGSLADTAAALNSALAKETPTRPRPAPAAALTEETPTTPLNLAQAGEALPVGRSILSSLTIPSGSGGRRRAGGEPPPGTKARWPAEPAEAPRWTKAERDKPGDTTWPTEPGATEPATEPASEPATATGWPAEPDISQPLRPTAYTARTTDPAETELSDTPRPAQLQAFGESPRAHRAEPPSDPKPDTDETAAGWPVGPSEPPAFETASSSDTTASEPDAVAATEMSAGAESPGGTAGGLTAEQRSSYEETKAELARMMSKLTGGSLQVSPEVSPGGERRNGAAPRQSIPTPPEPDDIPEPTRRPEIPEPPEPDPIPPAPPEPGPIAPDEPGPAEPPRTALMSAFDVLTSPGPVAELPSRKPRKSWQEIESSAVVESPADRLFGSEPAEPAEPTAPPPRTPFKSSLGAAFESFGLPETPEPAPAKEPEPAQTYDVPLGPQPRPPGEPSRRDRSDSTTIAGLLAEALAAYQSSAEDDEENKAPEPPRKPEPEPFDRFDDFLSDPRQSGVTGRHRSPE